MLHVKIKKKPQQAELLIGVEKPSRIPGHGIERCQN